MTVGAHLVTVISSVVQIVEVVICQEEWLVELGGSECTTREEVTLVFVSTGVDGQTVVDNGYVEVTKTVE